MGKTTEIFNISFLDIMTTLLIIGLILLFSVSVLYSFLPFNDQILENTERAKLEEEAICRALDSIKLEYNKIEERIKWKKRRLAYQYNMEADSFSNFLLYNQIDTLIGSLLFQNEKIAGNNQILADQTNKLKLELGKYRNNFIKRYYNSSKEILRSSIQTELRTSRVPSFYSYNGYGKYTDFETGERIKMDSIIKKHVQVNSNTYPFIIVEPTEFDYWYGRHREFEQECEKANLPFGFEPYNSQLDPVFEKFAIIR